MTEERTRIEALKKRLETGKPAKKATLSRLTVYLTPETRERIEELYAEVYYQTRAKKIAFLEEVIKTGLEGKDRVISALQKRSKHDE